MVTSSCIESLLTQTFMRVKETKNTKTKKKKKRQDRCKEIKRNCTKFEIAFTLQKFSFQRNFKTKKNKTKKTLKK